MKSDAEAHATEDKERRERIDTHNSLDSMAYEAKKTVDEHRQKIPVADLNQAESAIESARSMLEKEDASVENLKREADQLQAALHKISQALYEQQPEAPPAEDAAAGGGEADDVVDADYTEEK